MNSWSNRARTRLRRSKSAISLGSCPSRVGARSKTNILTNPNKNGGRSLEDSQPFPVSSGVLPRRGTGLAGTAEEPQVSLDAFLHREPPLDEDVGLEARADHLVRVVRIA